MKTAPRWDYPGLSEETSENLDLSLRGARSKFPGSRFMLAALMEEVGELAQALLQDRDPEEWKREALQVATVAIRIYEEGDSSFDDITPAESLK